MVLQRQAQDPQEFEIKQHLQLQESRQHLHLEVALVVLQKQAQDPQRIQLQESRQILHLAVLGSVRHQMVKTMPEQKVKTVFEVNRQLPPLVVEVALVSELNRKRDQRNKEILFKANNRHLLLVVKIQML